MKHAITLALCASLLGACGTIDYYAQAVGGQLDIANRAQPIETVLAHEQTPSALRERLALVLKIRRFASDRLGLPDNDSYRRYADLGRPYAVWNVFATPALSVTPRQWCFLMVGCVAYRGYFDRAAAERFAASLAAEGDDVYVAGIPAFSTLGWFSDPVLNTFVYRPELSLAGLMFHELAHQQLYIKDDSGFNESFATVVELEGVRRWAARRHEQKGYDDYRVARERREAFTNLVLSYREHLKRIYASDSTAEAKHAAKAGTLAELKAAYAALKAGWGGWDGYDAWFARPLNNAQLASVGLYHEYVRALQALLAQEKGDLVAFYRAAQELADQSPEERRQRLTRLEAVARRP